MGSGKTSWAIQQIDQHKSKKYIYITPYLAEIERVKGSTKLDFCDPKNYNCSKLDSFNQLLTLKYNIASTHSLFKRVTTETQNLISQGKYTLILDEVLDVIEVYADLKKGDMEFLQKEGLIQIDKTTGYITWNKSKQYHDCKYEEFMLCCMNKCLIYINGKVLLWQFPPAIFDLFEEVYILTYLFKGQVMKSYFEYHDLLFQYKQVQKNNEKYQLVEYQENQSHNKYKELINICDNVKLNLMGNSYYDLSKSWYDSKKKQFEEDKKNKAKDKNALKEIKTKYSMSKLKLNLSNYFKNIIKCKSLSIMWTTFSDYEPLLKGSGYISTISKSKIPLKPTKEEEQKFKCFVSLNCRSTNMFQDRYNLAYMINRFAQPYFLKFFQAKNIVFDEETYALSELLQWIWRSRIRNDEPINLYIPSSRMRNLLVKWLNTKDA